MKITKDVICNAIRDELPEWRFGGVSLCVSSAGSYLSIYPPEYDKGWELTYGLLCQLSDLFRTRKIDIIYRREQIGYSDLTPGDPSECSIAIRGWSLEKKPKA